MDLVKLIFSDVGEFLGFLYFLLLFYQGSDFARFLLIYICGETVGKVFLFGRFSPSPVFRGALSIGTVGFLWTFSKWVLYCVYSLVFLLLQILLVLGVIGVISFAYSEPEETRRLVSLSVSRLLQKLEGFLTQQHLSSAMNFARQAYQALQRNLNQVQQQIRDSLQQQQRTDIYIPPPPAQTSTTSSSTGEKCVICQDQPKCVLLLPCRHLCLCKGCSDFMLRNAHQNCPLCRRSIHQAIETFI